FQISLCLKTNNNVTIKCFLEDVDIKNNESFFYLQLLHQNSTVATIDNEREMLINTTSSFGQKVKFSKFPILNLEIDLEMDEASDNTISLFTCVIGKILSSNKLVILEKQVSVEEKESTNDDDVKNNDSSQGKDKVEGLQGTHLLIAVCGTGIVLIVIVAVPVGVWRKRK
ncbi:hypothetical protein BgiBS90_007895, partial [Biomphalaria glabrata]